MDHAAGGLVVVRDFDFVGIAVSPEEANPVLLINADTVLAAPVAAKRFEVITRRRFQLLQPRRSVKRPQLPQCPMLNSWGQFSAATLPIEGLSAAIGEAFDHPQASSMKRPAPALLDWQHNARRY
jgi:hypothetical protein